MQKVRITVNGIVYVLDLLEDSETPDYMGYAPNSANTRLALEAAFNKGDFEYFTPEPDPEEPIEPDWVAFQQAVASSPAYQTWFNQVIAINPAVALAVPIAAAQRQAGSVQTYLEAALEIVPMPSEAAQELQGVINQFNIPISLISLV